MDVKADLYDLYAQRDIDPGPAYRDSMERSLTRSLAYGTPSMSGITSTVLSSLKLIAYNLVQNSVDEAKGAARIQVIADKYADPELAKKMHRHVGEELKHSRQFLDLVKATGFETEDVPFAESSIEEVLDFEDDLRAFICRVHSIEIRSWTVLRMYQAELGKRIFPEFSDQALPVLDDIMQDEINHVVYTGEQIDLWLKEDPSLQLVFDECLAHTNRETWQDMASMTKWLAENYEDALGSGTGDLQLPATRFIVGEMGPPVTLT